MALTRVKNNQLSGSIATSKLSSGSSFLTSSSTLATSQFPAGSVIQTVSSINTAQIALSGSQLVYSTCGTLSITPTSSSSKILIIAGAGFQFNSGNYPALFGRLTRNDTEIQVYRYLGYHNIETFDRIDQFSCNYMDSPSTTSALTYDIDFANNAGSTYSGTYNGNIGIHAHDTNMLAMEIKG
tara:strand:+ start:429 stop:977 length:549 start_codon:yes stop_codon:yes gene_type:complete